MNKIEDFIFAGNAVSGKPDYGLADIFVRTAEAFANATYQSVYIIDYYRKNFLYVSPNPLFLCGMSAEVVKELGYQFYFDVVTLDTVSYPDMAVIEGKLKVDKVQKWADATENRIGKRIGFVFNDSVIMAPTSTAA